ncbi:MAG TPA: T9SS type A sorting domain-containing protein, partial [Ignavibacteriaceae bacterium]|nr:T9SS type A sorting domain-containing protein [Ignavibacteriaceae bacterium]
NLKSGEELTINDATIKKICISSAELTREYSLDQNYPNPFNPTTTIQFATPKDAQLKINIYNILGENVLTIAENTYEAGYHKVTFNASSLPSGIYIYSLENSDPTLKSEQRFIQARKMVLIK